MFAILASTVLATLLAGCAVDEEGVPADTDLLRITTTLETPFLGAQGIEGATVVVDDALGQRIALNTNLAGQAWADVDWARGPFDVTIDPGLDGQPLVSILDVDINERDLRWSWDEPLTAADTVVVAGLAQQHDPDMTLEVYTYGAGNATYAGDAWLGIYAVQVLPDEPFDLLALDVSEEAVGQDSYRQLMRWSEVSSDGVTDNTKIDIDMGPPFFDGEFPWDLTPDREIDPGWIDGPELDPSDLPDLQYATTAPLAVRELEPMVTSGTIRMPADPDDPLREGGQADVAITCAVDGQQQDCGWATWVGWDDARERYAFFAQHVVPSMTERVRTRITATNEEHGSMVTVNGDPSVWLSMPQLLPVPELVASDTADVNMEHWGFILSSEQLPDNTRYWVTLEDADGNALWTVRGTGDRTIDLPTPPDTIDAADFREQVDSVRPWLTRGLGYDVTATSWTGRHVLRRL